MGNPSEMELNPKRFAQLERQVLKALFAEPPTSGEVVDVEVFGEDGNQPVRYFIYADVLAELTKAARYRSQRAVAILLGHFALDGDGAFVEVSAFEDLTYVWEDDDAADALERGVKEQLAALTRREEPGSGRRHVVGMFWSEPGSDALLSEDAAREHLTYFNLPFQAILVCDGERGQVGLYARGPRQKFFNAAIHLVSAKDEAGVAPHHNDETAEAAASPDSTPEDHDDKERSASGAPSEYTFETEEDDD
ncbi:hypothetical protein FRC98_09145 [Lujinxingia vulgaris]|uniref:Uncharacterized protein n=1 Tax=Lujinxingia vulgaris TaxID=2600176 RepID=A0A5C6XER0_9DELT|nr:hypothetical protein [Lujinxingia vulgaris]TXD37835.1 hypothetical protein FRC98_09145 [Lujinxingia vulgaris]